MGLLKLERWIKNKFVREWTEALIFAVVVAFAIRSWVYAPFRVPTGSMIPTIEVGDQLLANMHAYGYYIPFSDKRLFEQEINKGDVIVLASPENPKICDSSLYSAWNTVSALFIGIFNNNYVPNCVDYVKRVIAVENDKIEFFGESVLINGKPEAGYLPYYDPALPPRDVYFTEVVPAGHVFVMGDNRRDSHDGRFWHIDGRVLSYVDKKDVRAQAKFIYFSSNPYQSIFSGGIRWDRIFSKIN